MEKNNRGFNPSKEKQRDGKRKTGRKKRQQDKEILRTETEQQRKKRETNETFR